MMVRLTCVARYEVERVDIREVVAAVHFNCLQESHSHPRPDQHKVVAYQSNADHEP